jgi:hypothetical protein
MKRKEVYGTSGQRMLLWFNLLNPSVGIENAVLPMGSETSMSESPRFRARALGAFEQIPGCPQSASNSLSRDRLERLCRGECYNPSNKRQAITSMEVIRIRPQDFAGEAVGPLIEDPWKSFDCASGSSNGCEIEFTDPEFVSGGRDTVYYVRALQAPLSTINADGLNCKLDEQGQCTRVSACYGDDRTADGDNCLGETQHRAWSSPIFIDFLDGESPEA